MVSKLHILLRNSVCFGQEYDSDLQRGLEQQRLLRERVLKMKEQRRLQQAGLRRKELEQRLRAEGISQLQLVVIK